ncbi:hypothetical protein QJS66_18940 [Kocuria rhizophila]|nr:hypothetical protein QJS66_18940 [Kocuria rhizophila]
MALPCAAQTSSTATRPTLLRTGVVAIAEGANMPCTTDAVHLFQESDVLLHRKAANAGGVASLRAGDAAERLAGLVKLEHARPAAGVMRRHPRDLRRDRQRVRHARQLRGPARTSPGSSRWRAPWSPGII